MSAGRTGDADRGPALLVTRMSGVGQALSSLARPDSVVMSATMADTLAPVLAAISSFVASNLAASRPLMTILHPSAASARAHALPKPWEDAITTALRPRIPRSISAPTILKVIDDLRPRREPDVVTSREFSDNLVVGPGAARPPIAMCMRSDVHYDGAVVGVYRVLNDVVEHLYVLPRRSAKAHGMWQVVNVHPEWYGDNRAIANAMLVRTIRVHRFAVPTISSFN